MRWAAASISTQVHPQFLRIATQQYHARVQLQVSLCAPSRLAARRRRVATGTLRASCKNGRRLKDDLGFSRRAADVLRPFSAEPRSAHCTLQCLMAQRSLPTAARRALLLLRCNQGHIQWAPPVPVTAWAAPSAAASPGAFHRVVFATVKPQDRQQAVLASTAGCAATRRNTCAAARLSRQLFFSSGFS